MDTESLRRRIRELKQAGLLSRASADLAGDLLDRVSNQWTLFLSREEACAVCGVTNWASARRSLNRLKDAGLIGLHTNMQAYVYFLEPPADEPDRAESARSRAETAREEADDLTEPRQNCAPPRRNRADRAEIARQRAESARLPRDQGSRDWDREGISLPIPDPVVLEGDAGETAPDAPKVRGRAQKRRGETIPPAEQARSVRLLTDPKVGLGEQAALQTAQGYPFEEIRRQVFRYLRDRADGKAHSPGCIPQRVAQPKRFPATITEEDRASPLWARHADADDHDAEAEERRRKYDPNCWED